MKQIRSKHDAHSLADGRRTDRELLRSYVESGSEEAIEQLVDRHSRLVWSVCSRILFHREDAEDAFQSTFLVLMRKSHRSRWDHSIAGWLYTVAFKTSLRIKQRRLRSSSEHEPEVVEDSLDPFDMIARQHLAQAVDTELQGLSNGYKTPLVMRYYMGCTAVEIAGAMNLSVSAVEGRLRRGKEKLKQLLLRRGICLGVSGVTFVCLAARPVPASVRSMVTTALRSATASHPVAAHSPILGKVLLSMTSIKTALACLLLVAVTVAISHHGPMGDNTTPPTNREVVVESANQPDGGTTIQLKANQPKRRQSLHRHLMLAFHSHIKYCYDHVASVLHGRR